jgi:hypothetical protein
MGKVAIATLAAMVTAMSLAGRASADQQITSGELQWINHVQTILGVQITDPSAAARAAETLCRISNTGADTDTTLKMMDQYLDSQLVNLTSIQRTSMESSALRMVCP